MEGGGGAEKGPFELRRMDRTNLEGVGLLELAVGAELGGLGGRGVAGGLPARLLLPLRQPLRRRLRLPLLQKVPPPQL